MDKNTIKVLDAQGNPKEMDILDFIQASFVGDRRVTIGKIEDGNYLLDIVRTPENENPIQSYMFLTKESMVALLATMSLYFSATGEDVDGLLKSVIASDSMDYILSQNLENKLTQKDETKQTKE